MYEELLKLARESLKAEFKNCELIVSDNIKKKYFSKKASFVTLKKNGELRGCIGSIEAFQALYKDVIDNTINAAFSDPRFDSLEIEELPLIKIEISILDTPQKIDYVSPEDLLKKIDTNMGIILKKGDKSATFLPQVWEDFFDKTLFLENLSKKAGLSRDSWKESEISYYNVIKVSEK